MTDSAHVSTPFNIRDLALSNRLVQAPLAGISCAPFRVLFSLYAKPAYAVTEMLSGYSMLQHKRLNPRYLTRADNEGAWCIQLSGSDPDVMYEATQIAASYGSDLIDLNCGCPKSKIRRKGAGSALMDAPKKLEAVVLAMRKATKLPLTVKIRTAGGTQDTQYLEAARIIEASGADAMIVHGRHYSEDYDVMAQYEQIRQIVSQVKIPVIANGDVCDRASMQRCFAETGAAAIMIGRGSIGRPWLFQQLLEGVAAPKVCDRMSAFEQHMTQLCELEGSEQVVLLQARRFLKWYFPELASYFKASLYEAHSLKHLYQCLHELHLKL